MTSPRIGSLFSGYGGLEQAVQSVLGGTVAWHSEIDPGARRILAHRYPDAPNLGDITAVDWSQVEPVDVLTGGFPCQDVSSAGKRLGLRPDTRSGLWTQMSYAIDQLRPSLVLIENVRGLLSAAAHCDLEPCPWCVGDGGGVPLRALGAVLGDLAGLRYDAVWCGVRASDVGAPHGRFRVFVAAWPADPDAAERRRWPSRGDDGIRAPGLVTRPAGNPPRLDVEGAHGERGRGRSSGGEVGGPGRGTTAADAGSEAVGLRPGLRPDEPRGLRRGRSDNGSAPDITADTEGDGRHEGRPESARVERGPDDAVGGAADDRCPTCDDPADFHDTDGFCAGLCGGSCADPDLGRPDVAPDASGRRREGLRPAHDDDRSDASGDDADRRAPIDRSGAAAADAEDRPQPVEPEGAHAAALVRAGAGAGVGDRPGGAAAGTNGLDRAAGPEWGPYGPAVERWERLTRPAPAPTEAGARGGQRLSPAFVEWMMGLPAGWVTDVPGLSRNEKLKALGNGVVPQQAAAALRMLLRDVWREAA